MDWSNLQQDYERLGSFKAVAAKYQVAPETVSRKAKELGVSSRRRWRTDNLDSDELRRLYDAGATVHDLASQFQSSQSTIYLRLWMAGTEMRASGPRDFTWGPEQYAKRRAAVDRGAYRTEANRERFRRLGRKTVPVNSPQEKLFQQALIKAAIGFETQPCELGRYWPDIKLYQQPVLIEIDSWAHGMPDRRSFDERRDAQLAAIGFTVVRFTNERVETDADGCVRTVIDTFGLIAEENPVVLIRDRRQPWSECLRPALNPDGDIV